MSRGITKIWKLVGLNFLQIKTLNKFWSFHKLVLLHGDIYLQNICSLILVFKCLQYSSLIQNSKNLIQNICNLLHRKILSAFIYLNISSLQLSSCIYVFYLLVYIQNKIRHGNCRRHNRHICGTIKPGVKNPCEDCRK